MWASFGTRVRSWSATWRHWPRAASASSWAKAVAMKAATTRRPCLPAWARTLRCTRQRCQKACQHPGDRGLQPFMRVRDHQLDPAQAASGERAQKARPERLDLRGADRHAQHLASTITVDGDRDDHCHRDDATIGTNLDVGRIEPEIRPVPFKRSVEKSLDLVVDLGAQAAHLAL